MTRARTLRLFVAALALPLLLAGCVNPSIAPDETAGDGGVPTATAPAHVTTDGDDSADGESLADLSEFPSHFPLPTQTPIFVDRVNYEWQIDYRFASDEEPLERAEWFGANDYQSVDVAEKVALAAGADARTWAWENGEFRVDLVLSPDGDDYVFHYTVLWK